tara:strand:- start:5115 stop:6152 length:1038 start_codon:yes stop_codon:yes gene_type:complete
MGKTTTGGSIIGFGFGVESPRPIDPRFVVTDIDTLTSSVALPFIYPGISVVVTQSSDMYIWNGSNRSDITNWKLMGSDGGGGTGIFSLSSSQYVTDNDLQITGSVKISGTLSSSFIGTTNITSSFFQLNKNGNFNRTLPDDSTRGFFFDLGEGGIQFGASTENHTIINGEFITVGAANQGLDLKGNITMSGHVSASGDIQPSTDDTYSLGSPDSKWKNLYAINTFFGGIHEINLETEGLNKMQEGTVLTLRNGMMCPCENEADPLVMGVVSKGENYPIVLGAEPVLVTGKVEEGDYIITSNIKGHGKGVNPEHIYEQQLFGRIIAQAIENGDGESYTIKAMIRKM